MRHTPRQQLLIRAYTARQEWSCVLVLGWCTILSWERNHAMQDWLAPVTTQRWPLTTTRQGWVSVASDFASDRQVDCVQVVLLLLGMYRKGCYRPPQTTTLQGWVSVASDSPLDRQWCVLRLYFALGLYRKGCYRPPHTVARPSELLVCWCLLSDRQVWVRMYVCICRLKFLFGMIERILWEMEMRS